MHKNQLQELAQRSCFTLPSYTCIREGPDHAPRFKAVVNFNGESFESPSFYSTLRQAEHAAAEVALAALSTHSLAARILDETGVYKNLLQEISQRVCAPLPRYATYRSGFGHRHAFVGIVELAGITFTGEPAKNKKQAEKNAALAAWSSLKQLAQEDMTSPSELGKDDEQEQIKVARALLNYRSKGKMEMPKHSTTDEQEQIKIARALLNYRSKSKMEMPKHNIGFIPFQQKYLVPTPRPSSPQRPQLSTSKLLPFISEKAAAANLPLSQAENDSSLQTPSLEGSVISTPRYPLAGAAPYVPMRQYRPPYQGIAPPVTVRTAVPVFSAPPQPPPSARPRQVMQARPLQVAPPVHIRQVIPVFSAPPTPEKDPRNMTFCNQNKLPASVKETDNASSSEAQEATVMKCLEELKL